VLRSKNSEVQSHEEILAINLKVDTWQWVSEFREKRFREITECKGKSSRSRSGPLDPEEHVVEIRVFGGKVPRRKTGEVKTKRPKHEVEKSIGVINLRKTCINRSRTSKKETKEKVEMLTKSHPKLYQVRS
jgi:hypothetical protein